jgi:hypothetical protein
MNLIRFPNHDRKVAPALTGFNLPQARFWECGLKEL